MARWRKSDGYDYLQVDWDDRELVKILGDRLQGVLREVGEETLVYAKSITPRRTGALVATGRTFVEDNNVYIAFGAPDVPYARIVHWNPYLRFAPPGRSQWVTYALTQKGRPLLRRLVRERAEAVLKEASTATTGG